MSPMDGSSGGGRSMCLSLHLSLLFSMYFSRSLRSLLGLWLLLLDRYLDFPLFLSRVLERDLERDLCLRFLSLLRLRLFLFFFALTNKHYIFAVKFHIRTERAGNINCQYPSPRAILETYRWSLLLCLPCLSALGIRASSSLSASAATFTSSSSSIFWKNREPFCKKADKKSVTEN